MCWACRDTTNPNLLISTDTGEDYRWLLQTVGRYRYSGDHSRGVLDEPGSAMRVASITLPSTDGPVTVPVISLPASAFADLKPQED